MPPNCTKRKREYRIHELLSNGQWLNLYFTRNHSNQGISIWTVGLCISRNKKEANKWYCKSGKGYRRFNNKQTGRCGLEGLRKALDYICEFADNLKFNEELQISWANEKRKYAYRRLLQYKFYVDEKDEVYHTRNLKYWEPNDTAISELSGDAYKRKVV